LIQTPGVPLTEKPAYEPLTNPMVDYPHTIGRAVTGGFVYRGSALPTQYHGRYFVADFYGRVFSLGLAIGGNGEAGVANVLDHTSELGNPSLIPTFGRGLDGELYFSSFDGNIYKIVHDAPYPPPAQPTGLSSSVNGSAVTLTWQPGAGGGPVAAYRLEVGSVSGASDLLVTQTPSNVLGAAGVPDGQYFVRVRAVNSAGASAPSSEIIVRVGCVAPPTAPINVVAQVAPGRFVTLSWTPVGEATDYLVEAGSFSGGADLALIPTPAPSLAGVVPAGTYFVRVRARNACGASATSSEVVVQVP
jgi:hypothetical protein